MGRDLALVGVGLRSNVEACTQLMERDLLGTRRLGVVRDDYDRDQVTQAGARTSLRTVSTRPACRRAVLACNNPGAGPRLQAMLG